MRIARPTMSRPVPACVLAPVLAALFLLTACGSKPPAAQAGAPKAQTAARSDHAAPVSEPVAEPSLTLSVFDTSPEAGRDPFFPNSLRRRPVAPGAPVVMQSPGILSSYLRLAGIWPSRTRPVALINKTSLSPGETGEVTVEVPDGTGKTTSRKVTVQCLEIRRDSVLISVAGESEPRELKMPKGL